MIEHTIEGLRVEVLVDVEAPEKWGEEEYGEGRWEGYKRDYFKLEDYVIEMIEEGEVEIRELKDMSAGSEGERVRIFVDGK